MDAAGRRLAAKRGGSAWYSADGIAYDNEGSSSRRLLLGRAAIWSHRWLPKDMGATGNEWRVEVPGVFSAAGLMVPEPSTMVPRIPLFIEVDGGIEEVVEYMVAEGRDEVGGQSTADSRSTNPQPRALRGRAALMGAWCARSRGSARDWRGRCPKFYGRATWASRNAENPVDVERRARRRYMQSGTTFVRGWALVCWEDCARGALGPLFARALSRYP